MSSSRSRFARLSGLLRLVGSSAILSILLGACTGTPAAHTSGGLVSFGQNSWIGGQVVRVPGVQLEGLELTSNNEVPASAIYYKRIDLSHLNWARTLLEVQLYIPNLSTFNNDVWGSRIEFLDSFDGSNGYVMWFDQALRNGLTWVDTPLTDVGTFGRPDPSRILEVSFEVYSRVGKQTSVVLTGIRTHTL